MEDAVQDSAADYISQVVDVATDNRFTRHCKTPRHLALISAQTLATLDIASADNVGGQSGEVSL